ncbi:DUF6134 family protein [Glycocaulis abyssi]|uniref:DUF6134 family protein n=1 Tax=Glycocaulis abyssi TaxID=1433403 RepID=A0ABV9N8P2_9PROT
MKPLAILASVMVLAVAAPLAHGAIPADPRGGETIQFNVYRGNSSFGTHEVRFSRSGEELTAEISVRLRAGVGPLTVFRYEHDSVERWRGGQLVTLEGETLKDGDRFPVAAARNGSGIVSEGVLPEGERHTEELPRDIIPSSHWRGYEEDLRRILNTEHGDAMEVTITDMGMEQIEADGGTIQARRIRLEGTLTVDLWYDENGFWAGCEFEARGQRIRYVRQANPAA